MSRRSVGNALMFGGPLVAVVVAFVVGLVSSGGAQEAAHRRTIVLVCLALAVVCAIVGHLLRPSASDEPS